MFKSKLKNAKKNIFNLKKTASVKASISSAKEKLVFTQTYYLLKKYKSLNSYNYLRMFLKKNPSVDYKYISEINKQLPKVTSSTVNSFVRFCGNELFSSYNKATINQFKKDILKITHGFSLPKNSTLDQRNKVYEYLKYLIRTNTLNMTSEKDIIRSIDRINAGLLNTKLTSSKFKGTCNKTYSGFINVLKKEHPYFVTIKNKLYLGKTHIGNSGAFDGANKLLLDLNSLDVYKFKTENGKQLLEPTLLFSFINASSELSREINIYLTKLKSNYIKYYSKKNFKTIEQKEKVLKRIADIFEEKKIPFMNK